LFATLWVKTALQSRMVVNLLFVCQLLLLKNCDYLQRLVMEIFYLLQHNGWRNRH